MSGCHYNSIREGYEYVKFHEFFLNPGGLMFTSSAHVIRYWSDSP